MEKRWIGVQVQEDTPSGALARIAQLESKGIPMAWLTMTAGGATSDSLTLLAVAATRTKQIRLGTAIVPTLTRHPLVLVGQVNVIASCAAERFVIGLGPSHQPVMEKTYGLSFERPLEYLREYVAVVRQALCQGFVAFDGKRLRVHAKAPHAMPAPIMISALRRNSFRLAGEIADGAISWMCPASYLRQVALPAIEEGAQQANRTAPPLVGHCFVALSEDAASVMKAARERIGQIGLPFYQRMFAEAGFPEASISPPSAQMIDALVMHGNERTVAARLRDFADTAGAAGAAELIVSIIQVGQDHAANMEQVLSLLASLG